MGNICRSPAAEGVLRTLLEKEPLSHQVRVDSAGTIAYHTGEPPDSRMVAAAARRGYRLGGKARAVEHADFEKFDLILAMDRSNLRDLQRYTRKSSGRARIALFCDYCVAHTEQEVPDPYYGGDEGFRRVLDLLEDGCGEISRLIKEGDDRLWSSP